MRFLRALRIFGAVLIGIGLLGFGASFLAPSSMIVAFGVRALAGLKVISFGVSGIGALSLVSGTIPAVAMSVQNRNQNRLLENNREMERKRFDEYAHDSLNPAKTRIRFEQLRAHNPKLNGLINHFALVLIGPVVFASNKLSLALYAVKFLAAFLIPLGICALLRKAHVKYLA